MSTNPSPGKSPEKIKELHNQYDIVVNFNIKLFQYTLNMVHTLQFIFSKKATKIDKVFTIDLIISTKRQIDSEDFLSIFVAFLENINFTNIEFCRFTRIHGIGERLNY